MITIDSVRINDTSDTINVNVSANNLGQVLFWTSNTFQDYTKAIDVSGLIPIPVNGSYTFNIDKSLVGLENFNGLFFLEFTSEEEDETLKKIAIAANFTLYQECLLDRVLKMEIKGCKEKNNSCKECENDVLTTQLLLDTLYSTVQLGMLEESVKIVKVLDDECEVCNTCPSYEDTKLINGYGFGTIDNSIILV